MSETKRHKAAIGFGSKTVEGPDKIKLSLLPPGVDAEIDKAIAEVGSDVPANAYVWPVRISQGDKQAHGLVFSTVRSKSSEYVNADTQIGFLEGQTRDPDGARSGVLKWLNWGTTPQANGRVPFNPPAAKFAEKQIKAALKVVVYED